MKDQYKTYADGEKIESGAWSDNPFVSCFHIDLLYLLTHHVQLVGPNGIAVLGQDQDNLGGGFDR